MINSLFKNDIAFVKRRYSCFFTKIIHILKGCFTEIELSYSSVRPRKSLHRIYISFLIIVLIRFRGEKKTAIRKEIYSFVIIAKIILYNTDMIFCFIF